MSESIYLFGGSDYNVISLSDSVADLAESLHFKEIAYGWDVEVTELSPNQYVHGNYQQVYPVSARELRISPRIPDCKIREFGNAIILAAKFEQEISGAKAPVSFWDNSRVRNRFIASTDQANARPAAS